jgi:hypothetical protein
MVKAHRRFTMHVVGPVQDHLALFDERGLPREFGLDRD